MSSILKSTNQLIKDTSVVTVNETLSNVKKISDDLTLISDDLRKGKGTLGALLKSDKLYNQIDEAVETATGFLSKYSSLETIVDAHSEYLFNRKAGYHTFGVIFQPKSDKYYYMGVTKSPFAVLVEDGKEVIDGDETITKRYENKLSLTLYMAIKFHFLTFKYGFFESNAGIGFDFNFFQDTVILSTRINEFTDRGANLKLDLRVYPANYFFVNLGSIYAMYPDKRDFYLGVGASFTDDDLKSILTVMPTPSL